MHFRIRHAAWPLVIAAAAVSCSSDSLTLPSEGLPAAMAVVSGGGQTAQVATPLPDSLRVRVTDSESRPVEGVKVAFTPLLGGGDALPDTGVTNADGRTGTRWVLGTTAGAQRMQAMVTGQTSSGALVQNFDATGVAAPADTIFIARGNNQSAEVGSPLPDSLVVRVADRYGNAVSGTAVTWAPTGGGAVSPSSNSSGTTGTAATRRTLGPTAGAQGATATAPGLKGSPVQFASTALPAAPTSLTKASGDNQSGAVSTPLADSVVVRLLDASGNGVPGRNVTFAIATGGGTVSPTSATTDTAGRAAARWTLGPLAGGNSLIATSAGFSVTFQATGNSAAATTLLSNSPTTQNGTAGLPAGSPPSVRVTDANGNPVAGVSITFAVSGGGGSILPVTPVVTNAVGIASLSSWVLGTTAGSNSVTAAASGLTPASILFTANGAAGGAAQLQVQTEPSPTAQSGVPLAIQPAVGLADVFGNAVSTSGTVVTASLASGSGTLVGTLTASTISGVATFTDLAVTGPAGTYTIRFTSGSLTPDTSAVIAISAGIATKLAMARQPSGSAPNGVVFAVQPRVQVQDAAGNPVAGVRAVTVAINSGGGTLGGTATVNSDASGLATFAGLFITGTVGSRTLVFTSPGLNPVVSSAILITPGTPTQMAINQGNGQTATSGSAVPIVPRVVVLDVSNNPVPGVAVTFAVASGGGSVAPTTAVSTDANGFASPISWTLGPAAGANSLTATAAPAGVVPNPVTFTATAVAGSAGRLGMVTQPPSSATNGLAFSQSPVVQLQDVNGNAVSTAGIAITVAIVSGNGTLNGPPTQATDANGRATFTGLSITGLAGPYTLQFTGASLTGITSDPINLVAGAATKLSVTTEPPASAQSGSAMTPAAVVQLQDVSGNPVSTVGLSIAAALASGGGTLTGTLSVATAANGSATFGNLILTGTVGPRTVRFTRSGLTPDTSAVINLTAGTATALEYVVQPSTVTAGQAISPAVTVRVRDGAGNTVTTATSLVTMSIGANPGSSTLSGTLTANAVAGVATFGALSLDKSGTGYSLVASATGLASATSAGFTVNSAGATSIAATSPTAQPDTAGLPVAVPPSVLVTDANGNPVANVPITFAVTAGGGSILPITAVTTNAFGIASLNSWTLGSLAGANTVTASGTGLSPALVTFNATGVAGAPTQLVFTQGPSNVTAGATIAPALTVAIRDGFGNLVTTANTSVTVALGANPGGSTLGGTKTVAASGGIATFSTLTLNKAAAGYTLTATATGLSGATSGTFTVSPAAASALAFVQQPTAAAAGAALTPAVTVAVQDAFGNTVTGSAASITVAFGANPSGAVLGGTLTQSAVSGIATFANLTVNKTGSNYTLAASSTGLSPVTSSPFSIGSGAATKLAFTVQPSTTPAGAAITPAIQVTIQDANGNTVTSANGNVTLALGNNPGGATLGGTTQVAAVNGVATFAGVTLDKVGSGYTLTANSPPLTGATSAGFNIAVGTGLRLVFGVQPSNVVAGSAIAPAVVVRVEDGSGNLATTFSGSVTMALGTNPASGTLSGTLSQPVTAGLATFSNLSVNRTGTGYTLAASATGASAGTSAGFNVTPGAAARLRIVTEPGASTAGQAIAPSPVVQVEDANGNVVISSTASVAAALAANPGGDVLGGTLSQNAVAGVATFANLQLTKAAAGYTVRFTSGALTADTTIQFTVAPAAAASLAFGQGPSAVVAGATMSPAVTVLIRDAFGNTVTSATTAITLALTGGTGGAVLTAGGPIAAVGGIATFSGLSVNLAGTGYALQATGTALSPATSTPFNVTAGTPAKLAFQVQPTGTTAGAVLAPAVTVLVQDAQGNTVGTATDQVTVALTSANGATLSGTKAVNAAGGVASFGTLSVNKTGSYTLTATSGSLPPAVSTSFAITPGTASQLVFSGQPTNAVAGTAIAPPVQVTVQDALGNTVTGASTSITVAIGTNPAGGILSGTKVVSAVSGVATFSTLAIDKAGTGYTLTANGGSLPQATSAAFNIQVGSGNKLVFITQPSNTTVGAAIAPALQVAIQDALGNTIGSATDSVQLSLFPSGALGGTVGVRAVAGVATFSNVSVPNAGTGYSLTAFAPVAVPALSAANSGTFNVTAAATTTAISSDSPDPSVTGQAYTVSFSVTSPGGTPTGNVTVSDGTDTCMGALAGGVGSCSLTSMTAGLKNLVATYTATTSFAGSASPSAAHTVNKATTVIQVASDSPDPSVTGQGITVSWNSFVASPGGGTPTGNVTVSDGAGATCVAPVAAGSCVLTPTTVGAKTLTASYAGDANFNGANDTEPHTVNKAATTTTIGVVSPNPASFGQVVTVSFGVAPVAPGAGTPTGSVTVSDGTGTVCTGTVAAGACTYTPAAQGTKTLTTTYVGDANFVTSASAGTSITVIGAATTTAISAHTPNPVNLGSAIAVSVTVTAATGAIPTGSVLVSDDLGATCSIASLTAGAGSCNLTPTGAGTRTLTAAYTAANSNFTSSSVTGVTHTVNVAASSTVLASSLNPSTFGALVTFTATVTTGVGTPTGTVQFKDGAANLGSPVALVGGVATFPTSALSAASHPITAVYSGDANHATSTSGTVNQVVNLAATATELTSSLNPSTFGQVVTFTATVTSGAGTPTGTVQFKDGAANLGTPVTLVAGVASYLTSALAVASHPITAVYSGDASFATSTSSAVNQVVNLAASTTGLTSSLNPTTFGQSVTFTATVTSGVGTPTGTVQFKDGATNLGTPVALNGSGVATLATAALSVASHPITAVYSGDATRSTSTSAAVNQQVNPAATATALGSSANPSTFGQTVTFTATVTGPGGTPTGTVQFKDGAGNLGAVVPLNGSGVATLATSALSVASHQITAVYSGDGTYSTSTSSSVNQVVNQAASATGLTSSLNPSTFGASVTFTATVTGPGGTPTGTVQFKDGAGNLGLAVPLNGSGVATLATSALNVASHPITAVYSGDGTYSTSTSSVVSQVVNLATTATALGSSANPSTFGQSVTFTATVTGPGGTPTGTVQFKDGAGNLGGAVPLVAGVATLATSALNVASHPITAVYSGDASFATSTSGTVNQVVSQATSATGLTSSLNPSTFGASVTFTATVTGPGGTPTGTVQFKDGAGNLGAAVSLNGSGVATLVTSTLSIASHPITAVYNGDANYATSTSGTVNQVVNQAASATGLTSSLNPSTFGTSVTFTATVTGPGGTPTGTVQFKDGATDLGAAVPLNGSGVATLATSALSVASHPITAVYSGDATYSTSTSSPVNQVVNTATSTTVIASSLNPSTFGQSVTFTATVTGPGGTPTGTVQFREGSTDLGAPVALTAGVATYVTTTLSVGSHPVRAIYSGEANYGGSSSGSAGQTVNQAASATALASSLNPSTSGTSVTFTATVTGPGSTPTGTVQFKDGAANLGAAVPVNGSGVATLATSVLTVASHPITAVYSGDVNYVTSTSSAVNQVVNLAPSATVLSSSVNPSSFGQSVTFTATVTSGIGTPTGTVQFKDGATNLGAAVPLNAGGVATLAISTLSVASHPITAVYSGDATRATSTSSAVNQVVGLATSATGLTSSLNPSTFGQSVTFTATVTGPSGTPTGTVQFKDGATDLGTPVALNGTGVATLAISTLSVASHPITAVYSGDPTYGASTSSPVNQVVNKATSGTAVGSSANPSTFGQSVTLTATVTGPGGTPTGTVQFKDGATDLGTPIALNGSGVATLAITTLSVASHPITAVYSGDGTYNTSTSSPVNQVVNKATSGTVVGSSANPSTFGQSVTFTATVTGPGGTPTGTVQFKEGATDLGTPVALNGSGVATLATAALSVASHPIAAVYSGDGTYNTSTSSAVNQVVNTAATTTTISTDLSGATVVNQSYTVNFAVTSPGGIPTGNVTVTDGSGQSCGPIALSGGAGSCSLTSLSAGTKTVVATYTATTNFAGSASTGTSHPVNPFGTATALQFQVQPTTTLAGATITPAVEVRVVDAFGNIVTSAATPIGLAIGTNPGSGVLTGGGAVAPVNGVATFGGLSIDLAGAGYTLSADDGVLPQAVSTPFSIN